MSSPWRVKRDWAGRWLSAFAITLLVTGRSPLARADAGSEAELQFELGSELYKQGRYMEAIDHFVASNRLAANPNVVLNVAQTFAFLKRPIDAFNWYSTYLAFELPTERRAQAEAMRDKLASEIAILDVSSDPSGAELFVDRPELGSLGRSPRKIAVEPGAHRVIARLPNHHDAEAAADAARGAPAAVRLALRPVTGFLVVRSDPSGADVRLAQDGSVLGKTPLKLELPIAEVQLLVTLSGYVEQPRSVTIADGRESLVELKLAREASTVAVLSVRGNVAAADVFVDRARVGVSPLTLPNVVPGPRQVDIRASGHEPFTTTALFEPGGATRIDFTLVDPRERRWPGWQWLGFGLSGALLAGGAVTGLFALQAHHDFNQEPSRMLDDRVRHLNTAADILFASGVVVATGTVVWDLTAPPDLRSRANVTINR